MPKWKDNTCHQLSVFILLSSQRTFFLSLGSHAANCWKQTFRSQLPAGSFTPSTVLLLMRENRFFLTRSSAFERAVLQQTERASSRRRSKAKVRRSLFLPVVVFVFFVPFSLRVGFFPCWWSLVLSGIECWWFWSAIAFCVMVDSYLPAIRIFTLFLESITVKNWAKKFVGKNLCAKLVFWLRWKLCRSVPGLLFVEKWVFPSD